MRGGGLAVAVSVAVLAAPVTVPAAATAAAPCRVNSTPVVSGSPLPPPPSPDPALRAVGGTRLATTGLVVPAGGAAPPAVTAASWLVADLDSGAVLGGCGPHEYGVPASVQKLLLAATMLPRLDPRRVVTVTHEDLDIEPGSSAVGLAEGGRYRIETIWLGLLLQSGNEAANTLARLGGGADGVRGGLRAMNEEARQLGAFQTHAVTPSGLDGPGQFTSAYDLALIARACFADENFRRYTATREAVVPGQPALGEKAFQIQNDNQLLYHYPGALGGKTGFTDVARHTYVGAAERDGRRLVVTLLGAEVSGQRAWQQGASLLDWGFGLRRDASVGQLVSPVAPGSGGPPSGTAASAAATVGPLLAHPGPLSHTRWSYPWWALVAALTAAVGGAAAVLLARRAHLRAGAGR